MDPPKYPEDFKGWKHLYHMHNNRYLVLESPDGTREACIRLENNDVVGITDKATGKDLIEGHRNVIIRKILDLM